MYEYFEKLLQKYGVTTYQVAKATGISTASFSGWKQGRWNFKQEKLQKIADYFGVPLSYLLTGENDEIIKETSLTPKDEREIGRDLDRIMGEIENNVDGPLYYNGEPIDDESLELLRKALELGLTQLKRENKVKYNPNKNKKNSRIVCLKEGD